MTDMTIDRTVGSSSQQLRDYVTLLKPRVMSLVVFTGLAGLLVAPGELHPFLAAVAVLCIAVAAGAAGAINMWYDRDIDAVMARTRRRPLVQGRVDPAECLRGSSPLSNRERRPRVSLQTSRPRAMKALRLLRLNGASSPRGR